MKKIGTPEQSDPLKQRLDGVSSLATALHGFSQSKRHSSYKDKKGPSWSLHICCPSTSSSCYYSAPGSFSCSHTGLLALPREPKPLPQGLCTCWPRSPECSSPPTHVQQVLYIILSLRPTLSTLLKRAIPAFPLLSTLHFPHSASSGIP